jgi:hypothetical protein
MPMHCFPAIVVKIRVMSEYKSSLKRQILCMVPTCGRAIAQAISRWLLTAAAQVRARVKSYGICDEQSGTGVGFLQVLRFPPPIFIPQTASQSPSIIWCWYNRPICGRSSNWSSNWTQSHPTKNIKNKWYQHENTKYTLDGLVIF